MKTNTVISSWFHDVDPAKPCTNGQLGSPDGRIQCGGQVNEIPLFPIAVVGGISRFDQVTHIQVGLCAVVVRLGIGHRVEPRMELNQPAGGLPALIANWAAKARLYAGRASPRW